MRAVFMGTPSFVTPILEALNSDHQVDLVGVYTPPDRPRGRGRAPDMPPVKAYALEQGLAVYQPVSLRSARMQEELKELRPDVIVVAAYGNRAVGYTYLGEDLKARDDIERAVELGYDRAELEAEIEELKRLRNVPVPPAK